MEHTEVTRWGDSDRNLDLGWVGCGDTAVRETVRYLQRKGGFVANCDSTQECDSHRATLTENDAQTVTPRWADGPWTVDHQLSISSGIVGPSKSSGATTTRCHEQGQQGDSRELPVAGIRREEQPLVPRDKQS
ncbi:hypothetical protein CDD80_6090 [Ophiocordyceps camponoti-rufipedis]|uniref:Uncharacterized protein n=1 Tax=Ophiocordyceps camponoti-rufipedis TaxID=2004952 RepID=A0A2C5ZI60_9HYPO|nr:hypothetical protein CDD80_6090 [Ophiocordyceps camponoti-rufipedis]